MVGTNKGQINVTPERAIEMAMNPPSITPIKSKRKASYKKQKKKLLKKNPRCHWCGNYLNEDTATYDHIIPLARGGLNNSNNGCLACEKCNHDRGHEMPEIERRKVKQ